MSREAMALALEALENAGEAVYARGGIAAVGSLNVAAQALRKALVDADDTSQKRVDETVKREHEWVGLTDAEVSEIIDQEIGFNSCWGPEETFARAIEAKLREKNHG